MPDPSWQSLLMILVRYGGVCIAYAYPLCEIEVLVIDLFGRREDDASVQAGRVAPGKKEGDRR